MTLPEPQQLYRVLDATWPPSRFVNAGPWLLREGKGGGQRVSAATAISLVSETDIEAAEAAMRDLGQRPIFMIRPEDTELDHWLERRGYTLADPVNIYVSRAHDLAGALAPAIATASWPPLAVQREIWQSGGVGPARIAVMERAATPKTAILGRDRDSPAGVAYVGILDGIAMLHALEVSPNHRRAGVGLAILRAAANWSVANGAEWLTLIVTRQNVPANALYARLSMARVAGYHYRRAPEDLQ